LELDGRAFRPHLTLARVKGRDRTDVEDLRRLSRASKKVDFEEDSAVQSIDLMKSTLGAAAKYECLHSAPLRSY
jgi:2'-5' RNA ligase